MILKEQDEHCRDVEVLGGLMDHPLADFATQRRIRQEILRIESGDLGERSAAHTLKVHFGDDPDWVVLNDVRLAGDGVVAQIDHILINRLLDIWLLESKRVVNGIEINELGEFRTFFDGQPRGMDSPIEQNNRHAAVVRRFIARRRLRFPGLLGVPRRPRLRTLVLISTGAIERPPTSFPGLETVIKSEQVNTVVRRAFERSNPLRALAAVSRETLYEIGHQFLALNRPIHFDWHRKLGLDPDAMAERAAAPPPVPAAAAAAACAICGDGVTKGVATFCRAQVDRFAGRIFCIACQPNFQGHPGTAAAR